MSVLVSRRVYAVLAAFQVGDAVACAIPVPYIAQTLDRLAVPAQLQRVLPLVKVASALGLLSVFRFPALARLTTAMLALYFAVAVGFHVRARDTIPNTAPAAAFLAVFTAMTVTGPDSG